MLPETGINFEMDMYASLMGYEAQNVEPIVDVVKRAYEMACGKEPPPANAVSRQHLDRYEYL